MADEHTSRETSEWREKVIGRLAALEAHQRVAESQLEDIQGEIRRIGRSSTRLSAADEQSERDGDNTRANFGLLLTLVMSAISLGSLVVAIIALTLPGL